MESRFVYQVVGTDSLVLRQMKIVPSFLGTFFLSVAAFASPSKGHSDHQHGESAKSALHCSEVTRMHQPVLKQNANQSSRTRQCIVTIIWNMLGLAVKEARIHLGTRPNAGRYCRSLLTASKDESNGAQATIDPFQKSFIFSLCKFQLGFNLFLLFTQYERL